MANTVTSTTLVSGPRNYVVHVTVNSDGTNETDVVKFDASALGLTTTHKLQKLEWTNNGSNRLVVEWDGATDAMICAIGDDDSGCLDWSSAGGLKNYATTPTGDITVTSTLSLGDAYSLTFYVSA